ncbi:Transposase DDE domain protein [uncultured archaeon]|nr:Transposase DDE domain protein [uncultured archaeon]
MLYPLIHDIWHPKWAIVIKLLEIIAWPRASKIAGRLKIYDVNNFLISIKVLILSDLFERDISKLVSEINDNIELKRLLRINSKLKANEIYKMQSNLDYDLIYLFLKRLFQPRKRLRNRKAETIIIDTSSIVIDLNMWRNKHKIGKANKKYKYSYGPSIGYYVGFKLILAINQDNELLGFEIFKDSPNDSKLLIPFIEKLFRARIIKSEDVIVCDKGFTSKANYQIIINRFNVVPIIYPRKNTNLDKIIRDLNPPLELFFVKKYKMAIWKRTVAAFKKLIYKWEDFKTIRSNIEDFFNIAKNFLGMNRNHQYTKVSIEKRVARIIFLTQKLIHLLDELNIEKRAIPYW